MRAMSTRNTRSTRANSLASISSNISNEDSTVSEVSHIDVKSNDGRSSNDDDLAVLIKIKQNLEESIRKLKSI